MKTIIRNLVFTAIAVFMSISLSAQPRSNRISREDLAVKQAEHISETLAFDKATSDKFKETYCNFQKELWELGPRSEKQQPDNPSEEEMQKRFERSQKILDLRKKYYRIYSTFLTQKQISRVYEIERDMMRRLSQPKSQGPKQQISKSTQITKSRRNESK